MKSPDKQTPSARGGNKNKPATPNPATQKVSGAGPAIAERSKDAKAIKGTARRQPGAGKKDRG